MDQNNEPNSSNNTGDASQEREDNKTPLHSSNVQISTPLSFNLDTAAASRASAESKLFSPNSLVLRPSFQNPVTFPPRNSLLSPVSLASSQPPTLFMQALSKLNESSLSLAVVNRLRSISLQTGQLNSGDITPPDSLASAPPSYSFVLRQMAARHRPRLMGTFIPSPSFVQQTPPPNYATAFDIYVDNAVPPPPTRVYNFGFVSIPAVCPQCGYAGMTVIRTKITLCTHMCAFLLCILCCWFCVPLPYILRSCKDVYHHCRGCRSFLGMYCPTNPDNTSFV